MLWFKAIATKISKLKLQRKGKLKKIKKNGQIDYNECLETSVIVAILFAYLHGLIFKILIVFVAQLDVAMAELVVAWQCMERCRTFGHLLLFTFGCVCLQMARAPFQSILFHATCEWCFARPQHRFQIDAVVEFVAGEWFVRRCWIVQVFLVGFGGFETLAHQCFQLILYIVGWRLAQRWK